MTWLRQMSLFVVLSSVLGLLMIIFIILPIFGTLVNSAYGIPNALTNQATINAILTSFYCASIATIFVFAFGIPLAYILSRFNFLGKGFLDSTIDLPILIPHNAAGIALLAILTPSSPIGSFLNSLGLSFVDTILGITVAMAFVSCPFMIRSAQEAFKSVDPAMERTARSLGATNHKVFLQITFPLALRGILTGCLLTWARGVGEFGAVVVLAYFPKTAPVYLSDVLSVGGLTAALPVTAVLIILAIAVLATFRFVASRPLRLLR